MSKQETILILDGNALLHRAWHAIPPLSTKDGLVVNAAYGFTMIVEKMIETFKPTHMAVAWDLPGGTFRHEVYEEYKGTRETKEQELYDQIPIIQDLLEAYKIPSLEAEGYEADDIIATIATKAEKKGMKALVVTGDLDALQLVTEDTNVVFFVKGISQTKIYDIAAVEERYGIHPDKVIEYKALRGDTSDNIPGVAGVGDKTATLLVQEHGTIEEIYKAVEDGVVPEKFAKKLRGNEKVALDSRYLVTLVHDVDVPFRFPSAKLKEPDMDVLLEMFRELEFRNLLRKYGASTKEEKKSSKKNDGAAISVLRELAEFEKSLKQLSSGTLGVMVADQMADLFGSTSAALALSDESQVIVVSNPSQQHLDAAQKKLQDAKLVVAHDLKKLMHQTGWDFENAFDTMIASYLLHSGSRAHDIASSAYKQLGVKVSEVPESFASEKEYKSLGKIVSVLPELAKKLKKELKEAEMTAVMDEIELPLVPVLYRMEKAGIELDTASLAAFSKQLAKEIDKLTKKILKLAGREFNIKSPSQLAEVLFVDLGLSTKKIKKTKTGFSTAASELEKLWGEHEIIPLISEYREVTKLQSTYVEALPKLVGSDGRIHTTYNQTVAATGRLSSVEPNLQNIPIKTELGREIRKAFIAPKGRVLVTADYSQVELRLVAVIAKDKPFIAAFNEGADIHTRTAAEVWEVDEKDVTKDQRRAAKAINFGIIYGMGPRALSKSTGTSLSEAKEFIQKYFDIHHAIRDYLDETKERAHAEGYVETMFGRRRYFPEIESGIPMLVAQAERMAINMPIQGAAADIVKKAMLKTDEWLQETDLDATMLLQVHDEIVLEVAKKDVESVSSKLKQIMEEVVSFDVPLEVEVEAGENWGQLH